MNTELIAFHFAYVQVVFVKNVEAFVLDLGLYVVKELNRVG